MKNGAGLWAKCSGDQSKRLVIYKEVHRQNVDFWYIKKGKFAQGTDCSDPRSTDTPLYYGFEIKSVYKTPENVCFWRRCKSEYSTNPVPNEGAMPVVKCEYEDF